MADVRKVRRFLAWLLLVPLVWILTKLGLWDEE